MKKLFLLLLVLLPVPTFAIFVDGCEYVNGLPTYCEFIGKIIPVEPSEKEIEREKQITQLIEQNKQLLELLGSGKVNMNTGTLMSSLMRSRSGVTNTGMLDSFVRNHTGATNTGTLVSSFARNYSGSTNTGTLSGTGSKTPIELLRERFYANQKARLEAHYEKLRNIRAGFLKLQEQE